MGEFRKRLPYTGIKCDMFVVFINGYLSGYEYGWNDGYQEVDNMPEEGSYKDLSDEQIEKIKKEFDKKLGGL